MKKIACLLALFVTVCTQAQSVYSQYGIGSEIKSNSVRQIGMGSQGISYTEIDAYNSLNPATLSQIDITRIEFAVSANALFLQDSKQKKYYSQGFFNGFSLAFPVYRPWGVGWAIGVQPYSKINYEIQSRITSTATGDYTQKISGSGGISKLFWHTSVVTPYNFQVGIGYNYYFGRSEYNTNLNFNNASYSKGDFSTRYDVKGSGVFLGVITPDLADAFGISAVNSLKVGFGYDMVFTLPTDYEFVATSDYSEDTITTVSGNTKIPAKLTIGLSTQLKNKMFVSLDYTSQAWSNFKRMGNADPYLKNMGRISLGVSTRAYRESGIDFDKPAYRFGVSYEKTPLKVNGKDINELSFSVGVTLPISWRNYVETALTYSMRGTTDASLVKEKLIRLDAALNLGEIWFIQQDR